MADPILYGKLKEYANEHRKNPTEAESIIWDYLKGGFWGSHFNSRTTSPGQNGLRAKGSMYSDSLMKK